jgi:hypothetical protein
MPLGCARGRDQLPRGDSRGELATGRELLRATGIAAELPGAVDIVDPARPELFGWAIREGLTNVVRHARASSCAVRLSPSSVEIVDDGVGALGVALLGSLVAGSLGMIKGLRVALAIVTAGFLLGGALALRYVPSRQPPSGARGLTVREAGRALTVPEP